MTPREAIAIVEHGLWYGRPDMFSETPPDTLRDALASLPLTETAPVAVCEDLGIPAGSPWRVARDAIVEALGLPAFPAIN